MAGYRVNFTLYRTKCSRAGEQVTGICICVFADWHMGTLKMWARGSSGMLALDVTSQKTVLLQLPTVTGHELQRTNYVQRIIIIIIIWHYNRLWVFTFSAKSLQVLLSLAVFFQFFTFSFFRSSVTSCHRYLGLPINLVPTGLQSHSFLVGLACSILWICPIHFILCALMNLIIPTGYT
jgi:hypothetical protein